MERAVLSTLTPLGTLGRYEILGRLGMGGMAEVFLARERGAGGVVREVVVKRLLPNMAKQEGVAEMFAQEARLVARLRHPNICPVFEFGKAGRSYFMAMEWVHGISLRELLERRADRGRGLPIEVGVSLIADIAGALHHAHVAVDDRGEPLHMIHRDATPENILVGYDGVPRLIDFGVAKAATQRHLTEHGVLKGKLAYMSPEQFKTLPLDRRSDVFSLGACLFEVLTGEPVFERGSKYEIMAAIVFSDEAASIRELCPDLPEELDRIVRKALARDRDARYETAEEMQHDLYAFLARPVRARDVAAYVESVCGEATRHLPELERDMTLSAADVALGRGALSDASRLAIADEADSALEELDRAARRKRVWIVLAATLLVLTALAALGHALVKNGRGADLGRAEVDSTAASEPPPREP